ncbi:CPBP family intramembrane glutamic endopeptidase [Microbacterium testaceum]|uniref:CPBP family intramembrane glutamic endopeptidase n=1 Tax=Microbacterium testaceum TaxID=2033 RepID=UPI0034234FAD
MTGPLEAIGAAVGVLAVFGIVMAVLDLVARGGVWWLRTVVEEHGAVVYVAVLLVATFALAVAGALDPLAALRIEVGPTLVLASAIAIPAAVTWYVVELAVSSASVRAQAAHRPGGRAGSVVDGVAGVVRRPVLWWSLAVASAVTEELIFRGMLLVSLATAWGALAAVALSAVLFGLHHISFGAPSVVSKTVGGIFLGVQTVVCGSVVPAIATHLMFQALVFRRLRRRPRGHHAR